MIIGWVATTATGLRVYESKTGRFFRDVVNARCREVVLRKRQFRRSCAAGRREPYLLNRQHLRDQSALVLSPKETPDRAA